jgi:methionyl-tRNA formyltransferase
MRVVLFSLTGFGNTVLPALLRDPRVQVSAVFTHKYENPFPYYKETALVDLCEELKVPCHYGFPVSGERGVSLLQGYKPDIILIACFREIIRPPVIAMPTQGIVNMHPSLLPKYRGVCPTNAVLLQREKLTGMTVHYLTPELDAGDILLQQELHISSDETDSSLRKKCAVLAGAITPAIVDLFSNELHPRGTPQDHNAATAAPRPLPEEGHLEQYEDVMECECRVRALNPFPGTSILYEGHRRPVNRAKFLPGHKPDEVFSNADGTVEIWRNGRGLLLWYELTEVLSPPPVDGQSVIDAVSEVSHLI